jgi:hypothetical protein
LQHCHVSDEFALVRDGEFLFDVIPSLKDLQFAAQNDSQADVPLPGFVDNVPAFGDTALAEWLKQRKLVIVKLNMRNALGVTIKLLIVFWYVAHGKLYARLSTIQIYVAFDVLVLATASNC